MIQNIIVIMIVIFTISYIIYKTISSLTAKKTEGCGGCSGCEFKNSLKGNSCAPLVQHKPRNQTINRMIKQ